MALNWYVMSKELLQQITMFGKLEVTVTLMHVRSEQLMFYFGWMHDMQHTPAIQGCNVDLRWIEYGRFEAHYIQIEKKCPFQFACSRPPRSLFSTLATFLHRKILTSQQWRTIAKYVNNYVTCIVRGYKAPTWWYREWYYISFVKQCQNFQFYSQSSGGRVVKLLACGAREPGYNSRPRHLNFQRLIISCFQVEIWLKDC